MSTEEPQAAGSPVDTDTTMQDASAEVPSTTAAAPAGRRRPRIDLSALGGGTGERKRGKTMLGVLLNTLNKAKAEDKERNASEAAKKRQLIEQKLRNKLKKETDSVRQAEEAKKDKLNAVRKEEELQLKDSIQKLRRTRLPQLSNFLLTSDVIPRESDPDEPDSALQLSTLIPSRSHPPPLYYLPAVLTPAQEAFLSRRKAQAKEAAEKEWDEFKVERAQGIDTIMSLRKKVQEQEERQKAKKDGDNGEVPQSAVDDSARDQGESRDADSKAVEMDVDNSKRGQPEKKDDRPSGAADGEDAVDGDDAVEY